MSTASPDPQPLLAEVPAAAIFEAIEARRIATDQMMWQVPALSLTAQSFLLTISLGSATSTAGRCLAALLGLVAALATIQLMLKHRFHEEELSRWLEQFAKDQRWALNPHARRDREEYAHDGSQHSWKTASSPLGRARWQLARWPSVYVWVGTLAAFAVADTLTLVLALSGAL